MLWLLLWTLLASMLSIPVATIVTGLFAGGGVFEILAMLVMAVFSSIIGGAMLGVVLYLLNLPFLFLALRNPFYGERFLNVLRLSPAAVAEVVRAETVRDVPALDAVLGTVTKGQ